MNKPIWEYRRGSESDDGFVGRIILKGSKGLVTDTLCDGREETLMPMCERLNMLSDRIVELMGRYAEGGTSIMRELFYKVETLDVRAEFPKDEKGVGHSEVHACHDPLAFARCVSQLVFQEGAKLTLSATRHYEARPIIRMPEGFKFYNASTPTCQCDMAQGPCSCGAWHRLEDWPEEIRPVLAMEKAEP